MTSEQELLAEQVLNAHRQSAPDGSLRAHRAWHDLDPDARRETAEAAERLRKLEAALSPEGHSSTVSAVLARLRSSRGTP
ncbi:MAG: hypothetical protein K1X89_25470 [Myxococcaceae bacterium]|nr:hypothetical protein [Myxococcaceae bacterium]